MSRPESETQYSGPERRTDISPLLPRRGQNRRKTDANRRFIERALTWSVVLFALYTLSGYFIIPFIINNLIPTLLTNNKTRVTLRRSSFDPFRFVLGLKGLNISQTGNDPGSITPVISIDDLQLDIEADSLFKKALICRKTSFTGVKIYIERQSDLSYNFSIPDPRNGNKEELSIFSALPPFSLQNISLVGGRLLFNDIPGGKVHRVEHILLNLPIITNLDTGLLHKPATGSAKPVQPRFSGVVNGSPIALRARADSSSDKEDTKLEKQLHDLDLTAYLSYLPIFRETAITSGHADVNLIVVFTNRADTAPTIQLRGEALLADLAINRSDGTAIFLPEISLSGSFFPLSYRFKVDEIVGNNPVLTIPPVRSGSPGDPTAVIADLAYNLARKSRNIHFGKATLSNGTVIIGDSDDHGKTRWSGIRIEVNSNVSATTGASFTGELLSPWGIPFSGRGTISSGPVKISGIIETPDLEIASIRTAFPALLPDGFTGGLLKKGSAKFSLTYPENTRLCSISDVTLDLVDTAFNSGGFGLFFPSLKSENGTIDNIRHIFYAGDITSDSATIKINPDYYSRLEDIAEGNKSVSWNFTSRTAVFTDSKILIGNTHFNKTGITAKGLSTLPGVTGRVEINSALSDDGLINLSGDLSLVPLSASFSGKLELLPLVSVADTLKAFIPDNISSGQLSGEGSLSFPPFNASGDISVKDLGVAISPGKKNFSCQLITIKDAKLAASPPSFVMTELLFESPRFDLVITDRKNPPITGYLFPDSSKASITSDTVLIEEGSFHMVDHSTMPFSELLIQPVSAKMDNMSNEPENAVPFKLSGSWQLLHPPTELPDGRDPASAPVTASGKAALFGNNPALDATVTSSSIDINTFATYLGPLIGYQPDKGDISIRSTLHLRDNIIEAENTIKVKRLSLGQGLSGRYNTPLATALLSDTDGIITINVPISDKISNTSFSYGGAIAGKIRDLLLKTTLSPYSLLDIDRGHQEANPEFLPFAPGSSELTDEQIDLLKDLTNAIMKRPLLDLSLSGHVDPKLDLDALQETREIKGPILTTPNSGEVPNENPEQGTRIKIGTPVGEDELIELGRKRVRNVKKQLIDSGISESRIHSDMKIMIEDEALNRPSGRVDLDLLVGKRKLDDLIIGKH